jgi:hypothetical protein
LKWQSHKLPGLSVRDYAPVVALGLIFLTSNPVKDFHTILEEHQRMLVQRSGWSGKDPRYIPGSDEDVAREQEFIVKFLTAHPEERTFHVFRVSDGSEPFVAPILYTGGLHNPPTPPCVNRESGEIFVKLRSAYGRGTAAVKYVRSLVSGSSIPSRERWPLSATAMRRKSPIVHPVPRHPVGNLRVHRR